MVKFGEIHVSSSPKIPQKFRQPPVALRSHSTKNQLKQSLPHTKIILSNTWPALFLCIFSNVQSFRVQCRFSLVRVQSRAHSAPWHVAQGPSPWPAPRTRAWHLPGVGGALARLRRRVPRRQNHRSGRQGTTPRQNAVRRRPSPPSSPRGPAMPAHARGTVDVARQAQNVLPAADGPTPPSPSSLPLPTAPL